jgi:hypothetical protein
MDVNSSCVGNKLVVHTQKNIVQAGGDSDRVHVRVWYLTQRSLQRNFVGMGGGSPNEFSFGQSEWGSGGGSPLVRGSAQFANE